MRKTTALLATVISLLAWQPTHAEDKDVQAQTVVTRFVDKGSAKSVIKAINKMHAEMEAKGWVYRDMGVYTEDGDLEGLFVTYVKALPPAAPTANP
ncbi:MAG: hypothetical protein RLZZ200_2497 [Pseudomonadota bacterium]|jgi:hypothetical protein